MSEEIKQMQDDEREALISIYEGDEAFKQVNPQTFQYKYGAEGDEHTFLVEITWGENYPNDAPKLNLNVFYNQHLVDVVKQKIIDTLNVEVEQWLGCGMTYTLFECLKDRIAEMMEDQPQSASEEEESSDDEDDDNDSDESTDDSDVDVSNLSLGAKSKKPNLTKAQKRRQWDQSVGGGEKARGWNWVDIVKHLSQCGNKDEAGAAPKNYEG